MVRKTLTHGTGPYKKNDTGSSDSKSDRAGNVGISRTKAGPSLYQETKLAVYLHENDLPAEVKFADGPIAVDTEAMGLVPGRDRLCLVQLSDGKGNEHLVHFPRGSDYSAPNLKALLSDSGRLKLYHFARFDIGIMSAYLGIMAAPVYCTRTASRLVRTYTDRHGLKDLVKELLNVDLSKQQQTSDWGSNELSDAQREYAASDVRYLHQLKEKLDG
jgi:ribonuclease D